MTWGNFKPNSVSEAYIKMKAEELKGNQHKLDQNKNGKLDAEDFKKLRKEDAVAEEVNKSDIPAYKRKDDKLTLADLEKERTKNLSHAVQLAKHNGTLKREEVEELDELSKDTLDSYRDKAYADQPSTRSDNPKKYDKRKQGRETAYDKMTGRRTAKEGLDLFSERELDMLINEVLKASDDAGKWISDFVSSDNPKFAGKSKEERKKQALAAYYAAQKKESVEYDSFLEEAAVDKAAVLADLDKKATADYWKKHAELKKHDPRTAKSTDKPVKEDLDEVIEEEVDFVKTGAKEIKHANIKDKDNEKDVMEPRAKGERDFLDKLSVNVTNDPAANGVNTGASKITAATKPVAQGAGKYDAKSKTGIKEGSAEAASDEDSSSEDHSVTEAKSKAAAETKGKNYIAFKEKMNKAC